MRAGRRACGLFLLLLMCAHSAHGQCLSNAIPAAQRRNVTVGGETMPLGIYPLGWSSARIYAEIFKILAEEVLGYNTVFSGGPGPAPSGIWGLAGCENAASTGCTLTAGQTRSVNHLVFEVWDYYVYSALAAIQTTYPGRLPVLLGSVGYPGIEANYLSSSIVDDAMAAGAPALDFYRNFNATWYDPAQFFMNITEIQTLVPNVTSSGWQLCSVSGVMGNSAAMQSYINWFGDTGGTEINSAGNLVGKCVDDIWWVSSACRHDLTLCVPYLTYNGWGAMAMMHKSAAHNMPLAIASVGGYGDWIAAVRAIGNTMTYWWTPDTSFIDMYMVFAKFPPYNADEMATGYMASEFKGVGLEKWAHAEIQSQAPMVWVTAQNIEITTGQMDIMLLREVNQGTSAYDNACTFLNSFDYTTWIPAVECHVGQGLIANVTPLACDWCPPSTYSATHPTISDARLCVSCPAGTFNSQLGRSECQACTTGRYSNVGADACTQCVHGTYQAAEGQSVCSNCTAGYTTEFSGSISSAACVCPAGTYLDHDGACKPCPPGMVCPIGNSQPTLEAGGWAEASDLNTRQYSVFRCRNTKQCLQGIVGSNCAKNRIGRGCAKCKEGTYPEETGNCEECEGPQIVPLVLSIVFGFVAIVVLCVVSAKAVTKQSMNSLSLMVCLGQLPLAAQIFTIFAEIEINWQSPMSWFLRAASALSFNIEVLNVGCIVPMTGSIGALIFKLVIYPICCFIAAVSAFVLAKAKHQPFGESQLSALINTMGVMFFTFYIALTILSASPFYCLSGPNGRASIRSDPSVLCESGDSVYVGLATVGGIGLSFYCAFFFGAMTYLVIQYPKMLLSPKAYLITQRYRFLFLRFTVERYFYGPVILLRGVLIAFIPIIFADYGSRQVLALSVVLIGFGGLQAWLQPWRTALPNCLDSMMSACLILILVGGGMSLGTKETGTDHRIITDDMQVFFTAVLIVLLIIVVGIILLIVYRGFFPQKAYSVFLSHHKGGCAIGARFMKTELTELVGGNVFLDSDELDDLENVLDIVRSMTEHLLILLTSETLKRPWCAGEIAMGFIAKTHTVNMAYDDYVELRDEDLTESALSTNWSAEAWSMVSVQGVTLKDVSDAYKKIMTMDKIAMKRIGCNMQGGDSIAAAVAEAATAITGRQVSRKGLGSMGKTKSNKSMALGLVGDNSIGEAVSFAHVLTRMVRQQLQVDMVELFDADDVGSIEQPKCLVTALTADAFTSASFAVLQMTIFQMWGSIPTVTVRSADFMFPGKAVIEESIFPQIEQITGYEIQHVRDAYAPLISILALPFNPTGNIFVMTSEVRVITTRLNGKLNERPGRSSDSAGPDVKKDELIKRSSTIPSTSSTYYSRIIVV